MQDSWLSKTADDAVMLKTEQNDSYSYNLQIFNAARHQRHIEAAPEKSGLVLPWPWFETECTHNSCVYYLAWSNDVQ